MKKRIITVMLLVVSSCSFSSEVDYYSYSDGVVLGVVEDKELKEKLNKQYYLVTRKGVVTLRPDGVKTKTITDISNNKYKEVEKTLEFSDVSGPVMVAFSNPQKITNVMFFSRKSKVSGEDTIKYIKKHNLSSRINLNSLLLRSVLISYTYGDTKDWKQIEGMHEGFLTFKDKFIAKLKFSGVCLLNMWDKNRLIKLTT